MNPMFWIGLSAFLSGFAVITFSMFRLRALRTPYGPTRRFCEVAPGYRKAIRIARITFWIGFLLWILSIKLT